MRKDSTEAGACLLERYDNGSVCSNELWKTGEYEVECGVPWGDWLELQAE